jgi:hypothetical protein
MKRMLQFAIVIALVIALAALLCPCTACFQWQTPKQSAAAAAVQPWDPAEQQRPGQGLARMLVVTLDGQMRYTAEATPEPGPIPVLRI